MNAPAITDVIDRMLTGETISLARLITLVECDSEETPAIMKAVHPHTGKAYRIGITGPPGLGKSTLVDRLTGVIRERGFKVGIIAVDPTSPFSGGAMLGDRIRMDGHCLDSDVFIRSMATRGALGGLPSTINNVINVMDAAGKDFILVETVGVGQIELDVVKNVDSVIVVLAPGAGDDIQAMKAGILEIADIFAINKSDLPGASKVVNDIRTMLQFSAKRNTWQIPVVPTQAVNNIGIEDLYHAVEQHRQTQTETGLFTKRRQEQRHDLFITTLQQRIASGLVDIIQRDSQFSGCAEAVRQNNIDLYSAVDELLSSEDMLSILTQFFSKSHQ